MTLLSDLDAAARSGDWDRTEHIAGRLRGAVNELSGGERGRLLPVALRSVQQVEALAGKQRAEIGDRLAGLKRGREAALAYAEPGAGSTLR